MFKELLDFGKRLEKEGKLPPPGFYFYKEPIKWVLHFYPDEPKPLTIQQTEINNMPRPYSGRTSGIQAYPVMDEAAYVLGINKGKGQGNSTVKKHAAFLNLLAKCAASLEPEDSSSADNVKTIKKLIENGPWALSPLWGKIESKDWISIQIERQSGDNKPLIDFPEIKQFWVAELAGLCLPNNKEGKGKIKLIGECSASGQAMSTLVGRIPLAVTLYKPVPLHSLNADAFVSGIEGTGVFKRCHIGQNIEEGDRMARTLNYMRNHPLHNKILSKAIEAGKLNTDSPQNLFAFYWIEQPDEAASGLEINPNELLAKASLLFGENKEEEKNEEEKRQEKSKAKPIGELSQLEALLKIPWTGQPQPLLLDENAFCLLLLSPNKGRISVREWFKVGLGRLKENLKDFLDAQRVEAPDGGPRCCFSIQDMLLAVEASNISLPEYKSPKELPRPNITRALLHCAYLGEAPPAGLIEPAVICFRHPKILKRYEQKGERERFARLQHQLAAIMKLILTHPKLEVRMNNDDIGQMHFREESAAFLSGKLLAVLEEAQLAAMNWKINTTIIDQFYSTASTVPFSVLGMLISRITSQHMPKLRKNKRWKYDQLEPLLETIHTEMDHRGGFPKVLSLKQQAEFSLGFYTQRAAFSRER